MPVFKHIVLAACLLAGGLSVAVGARPARATDFTAFGEDEDICRRVGAAAIQGASGPDAARRYDVAHSQCMIAHLRMRQMRDLAEDAPQGTPGNPHSFDFPDAFYSIPYATPGYGYDGFSP